MLRADGVLKKVEVAARLVPTEVAQRAEVPLEGDGKLGEKK
jgi:hypothetical protein